MKKLLGFITIQLCFLFGISPALIAQEELTKDQIYAKIKEIVNLAGSSLSSDCDPYGFQVSIKMSKKEDGVASNVLDAATVQGYVSDMLIPHKFSRFNLEKPLATYSSAGFIYISAGLTPQNAKNETFAVYFQSYTLKENIDGQFRFYTVQVGAQFIIETPNNGGIAGDVYYVSKDGTETKLTDAAFKSSSNEKKVRYRRLGPGDEAANSGEPDNNEGWKPLQGNQSNFEIVDLTPGHYFPSVKLNGCVQKLEDPDKNKDEEVIIKTEGVFNWDNPTQGQTILKPDGVNAKKVIDAEIHTKYSTGNTVEGFLLTEGQNPGKWRDHDYVQMEDVQILKTERKVWIEPHGWNSNSPIFPMSQQTKDGTYKFENIPSGVYLVYYDGQKGSGRVVEVCNCDEKNQPKQANMVYQQNMRSTGYEIKLDYKFNYEGESFNIKATWGNVVMAFGDEKTIPQKYSIYTKPNKDSLDNPIDIKGKVLQPPFVIIDDPYFYDTCGDDYRYCSDIFRSGPQPPIDFSYSFSGPTLSEMGADPDFRDNGLSNEFQAVEYKKDAVLMGMEVPKGIYFTWCFSFDSRIGNMTDYIHMEASEMHDWIEREGNGAVPADNIFAGAVDARVPDDVIEKIKKGEDFYIRKTDVSTTYTLIGTASEKTTTSTKPELTKESNLSVSVYPNPTNDFIILNIEGLVETRHALSLNALSLQLYDVNGMLLETKKIESNQTNISMDGLAPANYFLKIKEGNIEVKTLKIIKH
jgi:hypothetical protein